VCWLLTTTGRLLATVTNVRRRRRRRRGEGRGGGERERENDEYWQATTDY
jgi:hypothetical protein